MGPKGGVEGLRDDERGGKRTPHHGIGEPSTFGWEARAGREGVLGELEGPFHGNCGGRGPPKEPIAGTLRGHLPGLGRQWFSPGRISACTPAFSREKTPSRGLKKISRSLGFSACSASALRCASLPGLEGSVRVPAGPANHPVEALLFDVRLQLTAGGASRVPIMIVREWDPAADGHRVGRFGPGPGVRHAAVATLFGSRPRSAPSRRHVARPVRRARRPRGAKALLRDVELAVLVDRLPEEGLELRSGYPTPWHREGVGAADGVPGPSPSSKNEPARASRAPPRASRGPLARAPRSATPQGSTTPGYWAWPPSLAPARARRTRTPAGEGSVLAELHPSRSSFALETPSREITPTFLTR